jgi:tetratricopeptide (TPR) repeat protein
MAVTEQEKKDLQEARKLKVFISYSRRDMAFADRLVTALESHDIEVIIDRRDLPLLEEWQNELIGFIRKADAVVYLLSPSSINSKWCLWEVEQVAALNKRLAPIVGEALPADANVPEIISKINFLFFTPPNDFETQAGLLAKALGTDINWVKEHTRLGELARRWDERNRPSRLLLPSGEIEDAERWAINRPREAPRPTELHTEFIHASRRAATRRQRLWIGGSTVVAVVAIGLASVAVLERNSAVSNERTATLQKDRAERALDQITANSNRRVLALSERLRDKKERQDLVSEPAPPAPSGDDDSVSGLARANELLELSSTSLAKEDAAAALKAAETAVAIFGPDAAPALLDESTRLARSRAYEQLALAEERLGRRDKALDDCTESVRILDSLVAADPQKAELRDRLASLLVTVGDIHAKLDQFEPADEKYRKAIEIRTALADAQGAPDESKWLLAAATSRLAGLQLKRSRPDEALSSTRSSIALLEPLMASNAGSHALQRELSIAYYLMGDILRTAKKPDEALSWLENDLAISTKLAETAPDNLVWRHDLATSLERIGLVLTDLDRRDAAHAAYVKAIDIGEDLVKRASKRPEWQRDTAATLERDGDLLTKLGRTDQAVTAFRRGLELREQLALTQEEAFWQHELEDNYRHARSVLLESGRAVEALETAEQQLLATSFAADTEPNKLERVARALGSLCWTALFTRDKKDIERAVWAGRNGVELMPDLSFVKLNHAHALMYAGEAEEAERIYLGGARGTDKASAEWRNNVRKDFAELTARDLSHPLMAKIEKEIGD